MKGTKEEIHTATKEYEKVFNVISYLKITN